MKNSKLIELLQTFEPGQFRQFCEFVSSPYFNKNEDLIAFVEYLERFGPDFPEEKINKKVVFGALFRGQQFDNKQMAYLMNYLLKLGERFLAIQRYEQEEELNSCYLLDQFVDRKLDKHYNYLFKKTNKELNEPIRKDGKRFYYQYLLAQVATNHFYSKQIRQFDPSLQYVSDELDKFYFFHKLKYSCEMLNRQVIIKADYHLRFVEEVRTYLLQRDDLEPLIEIYLHIYLSIAFPDQEAYFEKLMQLIDDHGDTIDQKIRREIYLYAINYCGPKTRKGNEKYYQIVLNLYIKGIENKSLFDEAYLSHWTYSNVVRLALRSERYDWVETFIKDNVSNLPPQLREDAVHYNLAELYYHKKDFDSVLDHLNQLHFTDLHHHLGSRIILLKTYHEIQAEESLLSLLASFSVYLRRNKNMSAAHKKNYLNFCNLLNQLIRKNPKKWELLGNDIRTVNPLAERSWLLQVWDKGYS